MSSTRRFSKIWFFVFLSLVPVRSWASSLTELNDLKGRSTPVAAPAAHNSSLTTVAVPEPASLVLLGSGVLGLAAIVRRRKKRAQK